MARYFFHLHECGTFLADEEGSEHPDLDAVKLAASRAARDVMCGEVMQGRLCLSCRVDVLDDAGRQVHSLAFADALTITGSPKV